ncbi:MAG: bacterio-opsin activator domain-containing protein [Halobacteriota archaeon]
MSDTASIVDEHLKERAMDEAPVGIVISDPAQPDNPLIYVNDTFESITGYDRRDILGRNCRFLQGPASDPEGIRAMREAIEAAEPITVELLNYRPDGEAFWNEVTIAPIRDGDGEVTHFVGFQADVSDRKQAQLALEARTAELEHLVDRIDGLVHDVTEELMRAISRAETEQRICDRIVEVTRYDAAWIGEFDPVRKTVEPSSWAGTVHEPATVSIDIGTDSPVSTALDPRRVQFVEETVPLGGSPDLAVAGIAPLVYGDRRYGVLVVLSGEGDAFEEPEPVVLRTLGRTISTAINAAETRRTIAAENVVTVELAIRDRSMLAIALADRLAGTVRYRGAVEHDSGTRSIFLDVVGSVDRLASWLADREDVAGWTVVSRSDEGALLELRLTSASIVSELADRGARLVRLVATGEEAELAFDISSDLEVRSVVEWLRTAYEGTDLIGVHEHRRPPTTRRGFIADVEDALTDRQHVALRTAYLSGYYDADRSTTGNELAEAMGVTRSTFHQHLRAAERKLLGAMFDADLDPKDRGRGGQVADP